MKKAKLVQLPAIFCDIDGVVLKGAGKNPVLIGNSYKQIRRILAKTKKGKPVPFTFMTNGGMVTEQTKADKMNELFELKDGLKLTTDHINLCHTVYKSVAF